MKVERTLGKSLRISEQNELPEHDNFSDSDELFRPFNQRLKSMHQRPS